MSFDAELAHARRRWVEAPGDPELRGNYARALQRAGWPAETLELQQLGPWRLERVLEGYEFNSLHTVQASFSPEGELLARSTGNGDLELWSRDLERVPLEQNVLVESGRLDLGPGGKTLIELPEHGHSSFEDHGLPAKLWSLPEGRLIAELGGGQCWVALHLSDGTIVSSHSDETLRWWDLEGVLLHEFRFPLATDARVVVALPGGGFLSGGPTCSAIFEWSGERSVVRNLAPFPDGTSGIAAIAGDVSAGRFVAVDDEGRCSLRSWPDGVELGARELGSRPRQIAIRGNRLLLGESRVWPLESVGHSAVLDLESAGLVDAAGALPESSLAVHGAVEWAVLDGRAVSTEGWTPLTPAGSIEDCQAIYFSPEGRSALTIAYGIARTWSLERGERIASVDKIASSDEVSVSPCGSRVLFTRESYLRRFFHGQECCVMDIALGQPRSYMLSGPGPPRQPALGAQHVAGIDQAPAQDQDLVLHEIETGSQLWRSRLHEPGHAVAFVSPETLVVKFEDRLALWSASGPDQVASAPLPQELRTPPTRWGIRVEPLLVAGLTSSGQRRLAVSGDRGVGIFTLPDLDLLEVLAPTWFEEQAPEAAEWIDGFLCLQRARDMSWEVWDVDRGALATNLPPHLAARAEFAFPDAADTLTALRFTRDGSRALAATYEGALLSYRRDQPEPQA